MKKDFSQSVNENIFEIRKALVDYFGNEVAVTDELWINCYEGQNNIILKTSMINEPLTKTNISKERGVDWFMGSIDDIIEYMGIAI